MTFIICTVLLPIICSTKYSPLASITFSLAFSSQRSTIICCYMHKSRLMSFPLIFSASIPHICLHLNAGLYYSSWSLRKLRSLLRIVIRVHNIRNLHMSSYKLSIKLYVRVYKLKPKCHSNFFTNISLSLSHCTVQNLLLFLAYYPLSYVSIDSMSKHTAMCSYLRCRREVFNPSTPPCENWYRQKHCITETVLVPLGSPRRRLFFIIQFNLYSQSSPKSAQKLPVVLSDVKSTDL